MSLKAITNTGSAEALLKHLAEIIEALKLWACMYQNFKLWQWLCFSKKLKYYAKIIFAKQLASKLLK